MTKHVIYDNNPYLLIAGTDRPQRDGDGNPIANPHFGAVTEIDLPDPPAVTTISAIAFLKRLTLAERAAITASADPMVKAFLVELQVAAGANGTVNLLDADTVAGTNYLEQQTLIAAGRAAQILAP